MKKIKKIIFFFNFMVIGGAYLQIHISSKRYTIPANKKKRLGIFVCWFRKGILGWNRISRSTLKMRLNISTCDIGGFGPSRAWFSKTVQNFNEQKKRVLDLGLLYPMISILMRTDISKYFKKIGELFWKKFFFAPIGDFFFLN